MQISGIILAGGKSKRMGRDKALLKIGGRTMIEKVAMALSGVCSEIIIAGGNNAGLKNFGYPVVPDIYPGCGPLSGIHAGLTAAYNQYCLVSACDTPFLNEELLKKMSREAKDFDAVILQVDTLMEPLFSLYNKRFVAAAEECIKKGVYKVTAALPLVNWKLLSISSTEMNQAKESLMNINTPQDYDRAKKIIQPG